MRLCVRIRICVGVCEYMYVNISCTTYEFLWLGEAMTGRSRQTRSKVLVSSPPAAVTIYIYIYIYTRFRPETWKLCLFVCACEWRPVRDLRDRRRGTFDANYSPLEFFTGNGKRIKISKRYIII